MKISIMRISLLDSLRDIGCLKNLDLIKEGVTFLVRFYQVNGENKTFRDYRNNEKLLKLAIRFAMLVGIEKRNFR